SPHVAPTLHRRTICRTSPHSTVEPLQSARMRSSPLATPSWASCSCRNRRSTTMPDRSGTPRSTEEGGRLESAYGPSYQRLVELKNRYDPGNLFRINQNITPTV
ncbi:MAG: BBE domain-containing protein, partial [Gemmatimonadetes bacterium]|nr:BBE domain-containing protein [Gemmatimonadota bacterium]